MNPETATGTFSAFLFTPYSAIYVISFAICLATAWAAWMRRHAGGGLLLFYMMVSAAVWSFFGIFEVSAVAWETKILFSRLEYTGGVTLPVLFLVFIAHHVGLGEHINKRNLLILFIIPAATLVMAATNQYHHLVWSGFSAGPAGSNLIIYEHGPWFWFSNIGYSSICVLAGSMLLIGFYFGSHYRYQPRTLLMVTGGMLPWIAALVYVSGANPFPGYDLTRVAFSFSGVLFMLAIVRWQMLDLIPVARNHIVDSMQDGIIVLDQRDIIIDVNPAAASLMGASGSALIGQNIRVIAGSISWLASLADAPCDTSRIEISAGTGRYIEAGVSPVRNSAGKLKARIFTLSDVTVRIKSEAEKQELRARVEVSSRLATLGEMAAGIAHEINNPLTTIIGFSELLSQEDLPGEAENHAGYIAEGARRVKEIVSRMLTFARQDKSAKISLDIHRVLDETLQMRSYVLSTANIEVVKHYTPDLPPVMADPGQMQQVFLNLIVNAEHALKNIPAPARLTIITSQTNGNVRITFQDNGPGMPPEVLNRLFHPFFTTKSPGEGTGLGLPLSRSIVLEHGGDILARSEIGKGSWFTVKLPAIPT